MSKILSLLMLATLASSCTSLPAASIASAAAGVCSSERERIGLGEIMGLALACQDVFPDLRGQVDETMKPLRSSFAGCFAQYERPGAAREELMLVVALGKGELARDKTQFCVVDLRAAVDNAQRVLSKPP